MQSGGASLDAPSVFPSISVCLKGLLSFTGGYMVYTGQAACRYLAADACRSSRRSLDTHKTDQNYVNRGDNWR